MTCSTATEHGKFPEEVEPGQGGVFMSRHAHVCGWGVCGCVCVCVCVCVRVRARACMCRRVWCTPMANAGVSFAEHHGPAIRKDTARAGDMNTSYMSGAMVLEGQGWMSTQPQGQTAWPAHVFLHNTKALHSLLSSTLCRSLTSQRRGGHTWQQTASGGLSSRVPKPSTTVCQLTAAAPLWTEGCRS